jgi:hypothetical protein
MALVKGSTWSFEAVLRDLDTGEVLDIEPSTFFREFYEALARPRLQGRSDNGSGILASSSANISIR